MSDFIKGEILLIDNKDNVETLVSLQPGSADFFYVSDKNLIIIPLFMDNQVVAYEPEWGVTSS